METGWEKSDYSGRVRRDGICGGVRPSGHRHPQATPAPGYDGLSAWEAVGRGYVSASPHTGSYLPMPLWRVMSS